MKSRLSSFCSVFLSCNDTVYRKSPCRESVFVFCVNVVRLVFRVVQIIRYVRKLKTVFRHFFEREIEKSSVVGFEVYGTVGSENFVVYRKEISVRESAFRRPFFGHGSEKLR